MSEGKRPGGLTALAVINFVFAGLGVVGLLGMVVFFTFIGEIPTDGMEEAERAQMEAVQNMGTPMLVFTVVLTAVTSVLLLLSGIGYLKQKKRLGRGLGNIYGIVSIISSVMNGLALAPELGGGFNLGAIIGLIYPVLTLVLINTTFKEDFTR